ncbi:MAG: TonB family protein [Bacteroidota bacterium]
MDRPEHYITLIEDYQKYLEGHMTPSDRHEFEKQLLNDDFETEALEGFELIESAYLINDISILRKRLNRKKKTKNYYWTIAASVLLISVVSVVLFVIVRDDLKPEIVEVDKSSEMETNIIEENDSVESIARITYPNEIDIKEKQPDISDQGQNMALEDNTIEILDTNTLIADQISHKVEVKREDSITSLSLSGEDFNRTILSDNIIKKADKGINYGILSEKNGFITITGRVFSEEDGEKVPGVNIVIKGTTQGTVTDLGGNYQIKVPYDNEVKLVYSFIGYNTQEITVNNENEIDVNLESDYSSLSEVVVTGYGRTNNIEDNKYSYTPPQPVDGISIFKTYVNMNIRYPINKIEDNIKGVVKLSFTVQPDGSLSNIYVIRSLGEEFDKEAIRLVNDGPKWEPAVENGGKISKEVKVKIRFKPPQ